MLIECTDEGLLAALEQIAAEAWRRDGDPGFPHAAVEALADVGALGLTAHGCASITQWRAVRAVAAADPVVGRIYERHLEAVDHLSRHAPEPLRSDELDALGSGERVLGVWDEDPQPEDGEPARLIAGEEGLEVHGVKVRAVGGGGIDRAVVVVHEDDGTATPVYAQVAGHHEVDRAWRVLGGHPQSDGDRVEIAGAPVLAVLRPLDGALDTALLSRAQLRRVTAWMGVVDATTEAALRALAEREQTSEEEALAAGRMAAARRTLDLWLSDAARHADADPDADLTALAAQTRAALAVAAGTVLHEAATAVDHGKPPTPAFARARRELSRVPGLERADTALASAGRELLRRRRRTA